MKDLNIKVENGVQTLEVRTGEALQLKEPKIITVSGILDSPLRWLQKRVGEIDQKKAHILVDRDKMNIVLVMDESSYYAQTITGSLQLHPLFVKFGINAGNYRTPLEMSELIKMHRSYFENHSFAMQLVSLLRSFKGKIDKEVEAEYNPNRGDKRLLIAQKVESNLPESFTIRIPIFKGTEPQDIECETYFNPDDLTCTLVSAGAMDSVQEIKDTAIDKVLDEIKSIAPDIAIIEK